MTVNGGQQVRLSFIHKPPAGGKAIFTTTVGEYLGSIEFEATSNEALREIANQFQAFVAAQTGGIQVAGAGMASNLKLA